MSQPSVSRHHADWLSLIEVSGPFVSLPVLMRVFPQGLEPRDPAQAKALRATYEEWQDDPAAPGKQHSWVMHVLTAVLGYTPGQIAEGQTLPAGLEAKMPEMGETLRPDFALVGTAGSDTVGQAQLLIASYPAEQALHKPVIDKHWKATPATRMMELLHGTDVPLGLVTNGEHWMLIYAPRGETTGYTSWYGALWLDEPITLRAFHSLLGVRRFFGVAADSTLLAMLKESANDQQEVTDQLGYQVREAVEVLVKSVDTLDRENHRALLKDVPETVLYDAALTIMMRLVFLFAAEERGLLHLGKPLYDDNYAVSTLQEQLQEVADQHGEEVLERRFDAWARLLATFRAVHGGIQHQDLLMLAYGGSLFDPDRYPFLEGRAPQSSWRTSAAEPLAVNNRVVLHLLNSLQRLQVRVPGGGPAESRRISFRALGVEQIGHVYEGLLDRTAVRASAPVLGVKGARDKEREIPLATLESLSTEGRDKLVEFLKDETGRSLSALRRELDGDNQLDEHKLLITCGHDKKLMDRLRPFASLIREDSFGRLVVALTESIYVTAATTRRSTGTHYTLPSLTEPIVQHTMEPLVYEGPAEGLPRGQWKLKSPKTILDLKVCDMAMGSGAFLVQACRYMAERLVESWENLESQHPGEVLITPEGTFSTGTPSERLVPADTNERIAIAHRVVADRCLYGVDINPMAVEMAKLSLWLITLQRDRPFSFLDHALKCGDSLLGVSSIKQIDNFSLRPGERQITFATANLSRYVEDASAKRRVLEDLPSNDHIHIQTKNRLHAEAEAATARVKALADCLLTLELLGLDGESYEDQRAIAADHAGAAMGRRLIEFETYAREQLHGRRTFHWSVEFPEVFASGGFDAFVGNPPFITGTAISTHLGHEYKQHLKQVWPHIQGRADLCVIFMLRAGILCRRNGVLGFVGSNSTSETDSRISGPAYLLANGFTLFRAIKSMPWPGSAAVFICQAHFYNGKWAGKFVLDGKDVDGIDSGFTAYREAPEPFTLRVSADKSFTGTKVYGNGFVLSPSEAEDIIRREPLCREVIKPYLIGKELNDDPKCRPARFIIDFTGLSAKEAQHYSAAWTIANERVREERQSAPEPRMREIWWQFQRPRIELYCKLKELGFAWVVAATSDTLAFVGIPYSRERPIVFSHAVNVLALSGFGEFAAVQGSLHLTWARRYGSSLKGDFRYTTTDCFENFPLPTDSSVAREIGQRYHEFRQQIMLSQQEGLTKTYKRFHDRCEKSVDIAQLRALHVEMDQAVAAAYGWSNLDLGHGFHHIKQGARYTISEPARRTVLDRLLALNHQRHAEEEAEKTAHAVTAPVKRGRKKKNRADKLTLDLL
jgi:hypothetical protein